MANPPPQHQCDRCKKCFRVPAELKRHEARKRPCRPVVEGGGDDAAPAGPKPHACKFCNRVFTQAAHVKRHQLTSCPISPRGKNGADGMELLYQHVEAAHLAQLQQQDARIRELESRLAALGNEALVAAQKSACGGLTINGDHARVLQMDVRVFPEACRTNPFGAEEMGHLRRGDVYKAFNLVAPRGLLWGCGGRPAVAKVNEESMLSHLCGQLITRAAMMIYSDPEHPENITCYLPRKTKENADNAMTFMGGTTWELQPLSIVFPPMIQKVINLLFDSQPVPGVDGCPGEADTFSKAQQAAFGQLLRYISQNEEMFAMTADTTLRPILVRNADLYKRLCEGVSAIHQPKKIPPVSSLIEQVS